ncbi:MAG: CRTAC1 family protein [Myxococcales bacterium]|nr:CRTAC1 family protein [Myxococcales bacterium]
MPRLALPLALLALAACGAGSPSPGDGDDEATTSEGETDDEGSGARAPAILGAPAVAARGAHLFLLTDTPLAQLQVELGGVALGEAQLLHADFPGAVLRVPAQVELGPSVLAVRRRDDPQAVAEHELEVVDPVFVDVAEATGLAQTHDPSGSPPECAESHTGLAFGDFDGDGDPDAFVGQVGTGGRLHRNRGDEDGDGVPELEDVTEAMGLAGVDQVAMATFVDLEGDGDLDLFVGRRGANRVFANQLVPTGTAGFQDVTEAIGLGVESQRTMGVAFGDYDGDDDLDLYVVNHAYCFPQAGSEIRAGDHLYRNDDGVFVERTGLLDPAVLSSVGFSASWVDVERDGDLDLIVINDDVGGMIGNPNALWRNDGPGEAPSEHRFTDVSMASGVGIERINGMGLALGDVDHDGFVDLAFSNIGENVLLLNAGDGTFVDVSDAAGIRRAQLPWARTSITWAAHLWDHDNDGDLDLYYAGGRIKGDALIPDAFFDNRGDGTFEDRTWAVGLTDPASGKASALVDLDRDGSWELATAAWGDELKVYRNDAARSGAGHHWLDVELRGRGGNREAVGAIVELRSEGGTQTCFHTNRPSLGAGGETACHFGLGTSDRIERLTITWPDGSVSQPTPPAVDGRVEYVQAG